MWRIGLWGLALAAGWIMSAGFGWTNDAPLTSTVLGKIHHSNLKEAELGGLAQRYGHSQEARELGRTVADERTASDQKIVSLASAELIDLPSHTVPLRPGETAGIPTTTTDFDLVIARIIFDDAEQELTEESAARDDTGDDRLRALIDERIPLLRAHRDAAKKIADVGGPLSSR
jgi:predicted outer membrane protein